MGVKHLWIDSLCIVQSGDDGKDWLLEAVRMARYYQQALATFAATANGVLFPGDATVQNRLVQLPYRDRYSHQRGHFYIQRIQYLNDEYQRDVQDSELMVRGWVFQEFLLSRRILWFTPTNIIYECQAAWPIDVLGQTTTNGYLESIVEAPLTKQIFSLPTKGATQVQWYALVEAYSGLQFTQPAQDRTIALSGYATEFTQAFAVSSPATKPRYVADWRGAYRTAVGAGCGWADAPSAPSRSPIVVLGQLVYKSAMGSSHDPFHRLQDDDE